MSEELFVVEEGFAGMRLDRFLSEVSELSRSAAVRLIEDAAVLVNGKPADKKFSLSLGDAVSMEVPEPEPYEATPEDIPLDIIYEDNDIIVINKPVGMVVHPAAGNPNGTLVNALLFHCRDSLSGIGGVMRPGIVHRIDKDTSGLLVVAKNDASHLFLAEQIKVHAVKRIYEAIAIGNFKEDFGTVDAPIGRHPTDRKRMAIIKNTEYKSRDAVTHWSVLERGFACNQAFTHVKCELETGRTHQIRVHLASLGHPLLGDPVYGGDKTAFGSKHKDLIVGQALHAGTLTLTHPTTKREMTFHAPLPENFQKLLTLLFQSSTHESEQTE